MEINIEALPWYRKRWVRWLSGVLIVTLLWGGYRIYKDITMPPPLVFLIPDDYFGPVFFFFDQPDGVDVQPDPLGNAVTIPENGILKIKGKSKDLVSSFAQEKQRPIYWVSVSAKDERKLLKVNVGVWKNEEGQWLNWYVDENSVLHKLPVASSVGKPRFYYLTEKERDDLMVFAHGGCAHQEFTPNNDPSAATPACGKFLVVSPNQKLNLPDFMWEEFEHPFSSIDDLIKQANEALEEKRVFYKLPRVKN